MFLFTLSELWLLFTNYETTRSELWGKCSSYFKIKMSDLKISQIEKCIWPWCFFPLTLFVFPTPNWKYFSKRLLFLVEFLRVKWSLPPWFTSLFISCDKIWKTDTNIFYLCSRPLVFTSSPLQPKRRLAAPEGARLSDVDISASSLMDVLLLTMCPCVYAERPPCLVWMCTTGRNSLQTQTHRDGGNISHPTDSTCCCI